MKVFILSWLKSQVLLCTDTEASVSLRATQSYVTCRAEMIPERGFFFFLTEMQEKNCKHVQLVPSHLLT